MTEQSYFQIKQYIADNTGIVYYQDKDKDLSHKIEKRMQSIGIKDYTSYWNLIADKKKGAKEFDLLVNMLTIGETYFFRDKAVFKGLKEIVIPQVMEKNRHSRSMRIWSAGCASGEEAYSISILLKREFSHLLAAWDITILGTDINRDFIAQAINGRYSDWSFRETAQNIKQSCFITEGKTWQIKPEYKTGTTFEYHNLVKNPFPSLVQNLVAFDIILNRNVIIYFDEPTTQKLIRQFESSLVEGGWFIVGHADHNIKYFTGFKAVSIPGAYFYRKQKEPREKPVHPHRPQPPPLVSISLPPLSPPVTKETPGDLRLIPPPKARIKGEVKDSELKKLCILTNRGEWNQALAFAQQLMTRDNLNPVVYFFQALIREQMGQVHEAEQLLRKTLYLDRNFVLAHYHLGLLLQKTRNIKGAKKSFENVYHLLDKYEENYIFEIADDISASQLKELAEFNLEVLEKYGSQK